MLVESVLPGALEYYMALGLGVTLAPYKDMTRDRVEAVAVIVLGGVGGGALNSCIEIRGIFSRLSVTRRTSIAGHS